MAQQLAINAANFGKSYLRVEDYLCYAGTALSVLAGLEEDSDLFAERPPIERLQDPPVYRYQWFVVTAVVVEVVVGLVVGLGLLFALLSYFNRQTPSRAPPPPPPPP